MRKLCYFSIALLFLCALATPTEAYRVTTSIRPLYGIAAAVAGDDAEVSLILDAPVSAHDATTKPSHITRIQQSDLILMIDRDFERFLDRPLRRYAGRRPVIEAAKIPGVEVLNRQILDLNPTYDWRKPVKTADQVLSDGLRKDYHLWLEPNNVLIIARQVHAQLVKALPEKKARLDQNLAIFEAKVRVATEQTKAALQPYQEGGFVTSHDGYQYFTRAFVVRQLGSIGEETTQLSDPEHRKNILRILGLDNAKCIIKDSESRSREPQKIAKKTKKPLFEADPMGQKLPLGPDLYPQIIQQMGQIFVDCLGSGQPLKQ
jgi:zinc transport system substrate-binding protein